MYDILEIKKRLPHRYPFLFVDKALEIIDGESCVAVKNFTSNELIFQGHFPQKPIVPGVILIEALAQAASLSAQGIITDVKKEIMVLAGVDQAKFKKPVVPGDQVILRTKFIKKKLNLMFVSGEAYILENNQEVLAASAIIKTAILKIN